MNDIVVKIKNVLDEKRMLTDKEIFEIIDGLLCYYHVRHYISNINLGYKAEIGSFSGYNYQRRMCYFDFDAITSAVFNNKKSEFSFFEMLILEQLRHILCEVRHIMQKNDDFEDKISIRQIINDCDISKYIDDINEDNYYLFPQLKDARVFSLVETIDIIKMCGYFDKNSLRIMYNEYFRALIKDYKFENNYEGTLKDFYIKIYGSIDRYYEVVGMIDSLMTHEKMSFNLPLNEIDKKNILIVPDLIYRGHNPSLVLKNEIKRR